ncbi:alpha-galactosidase, partial [Bifidobacterium ramosum]
MNQQSASEPPMGWNSWDSYGTAVNENAVLANARFMHDYLLQYGWNTVVVDIDWYDPTAKSHGYNADAPIVLDDFGRQLPAPMRFPSARNGDGFRPLANRIHDMGLKFGVHIMRGIPRLAVERNCPILGTEWSASDVADKEHVCGWNPDNYGLKPGHPGAQAYYDAQVDQLVSWGVDFIKADDMQVPFHADEIRAYASAIRKAEQRYGKSVVFSLSPGGALPTTHIDFLREHAQMWRISDDLWDKWSVMSRGLNDACVGAWLTVCPGAWLTHASCRCHSTVGLFLGRS